MTNPTAIRPPYLLVGEQPNRATAHRPDLWLLPDDSGMRHSANRLLDYSGLSLDRYLELFERTNLVQTVVERWPAASAASNAEVMLDHASSTKVYRRRQNVLCLGRKVADAFDLKGIDPLTWRRLDHLGIALCYVPHPSGRNPWWMDLEHVAAARAFFASLGGTPVSSCGRCG